MDPRAKTPGIGEAVSMKILGISGSLQGRSTNTALILAAAEVAPEGVEVTPFEGIGGLPHFNPDLDGDDAPGAVVAFRERLGSADALIVATPEYAHGAPGVLKNALDWVVGSGELMHKPIGLVSASPNWTGGMRAQLVLIPTLLVMDTRIVAQATFQLGRKDLDEGGRITNPATLGRVAEVVGALAAVRAS